jgi:glycosyltransferase involved in cell wall biosynthesis
MRRRSRRKSVLYVGQSYYHCWYLSRELRRRGWRADVLNWDDNPGNQRFYHGEDFRFTYRGLRDVVRQIVFYIVALFRYDVFHFSNARAMKFGRYLPEIGRRLGREHLDVEILRLLGKRIVYSNNGCLDGATQTGFASWGDRPVCVDCHFRNRPEICSDATNRTWGTFRNLMADYQITTGGNRVDFNDDPRVHEVPQFYCLDPEVWRPDLLVPTNLKLHLPPGTVAIYHAVGNFEVRANRRGTQTIKSTHIYVPLVERLKAEGLPVELIFFKDVPNRQLRYYQAQADIVVDMLTFGWFGATVREGLMMGKPCVCYLRSEWLASQRTEVPAYIDELPVVTATEETIEDVLRELVASPELREELGRRGRRFALKWHSADAAARRLDEIYRDLLAA